MGNFDFLLKEKDYEVFGKAAVEAEKVFHTSPAMCAIGARKALELAVKWVYAAERLELPYKDTLSALIHDPSFRLALPYDTWKKLPLIVKLGNLAVHTTKNVAPADAVMSLRALFEFVEWIDYCYGKNYAERRFDEKKIPVAQVRLDEKRIKEQASLLKEKEAETQKLYDQIKQLSAQLTAAKAANQAERHFDSESISEFTTRKVYIDVDMKEEGWIFDGPRKNVEEEYPLDWMNGVPGKKGYADYVLFGKDGSPLAVVEAKKTSKDPNVGKIQAALYADALEHRFHRRPMIFYTNGFETYFWDDKDGTPRQVSGIFGEEDLQRLMMRRLSPKPALSSLPISDDITNRAYQKEAIRAVCAHMEAGVRKNLLVMATGTGKTRTAASLVDVLSRGNRITNVLFLADRTALVRQAKDAFREYLPRMSLCNLLDGKDDKNARIVFSTYPTILNAIDDTKSKNGERLFSPAHFDLIIIDESHRSIFKKYRTIFDYFDAMLVGLTATPKTDVDRNTYDFFDMQQGMPTFAYGYEEAINQHFLVPYYNYEVTTQFTEEGIHYDELSAADRERYEDDFAEDDGQVPLFVPSQKLNKFVFNQKTVDLVLQDLMERGIKVHGGDRLGKTIIFAENKRHAQFIVDRFNALYPQYHGTFAQRVVCDDAYAESVIDHFKNPEQNPVIAVSVDMLDTGVDVPECVNLVFFKKVRSKTKFWQMIGRGTRLAPDLACVDSKSGEYVGKKYFFIFDYCQNFKFFREKENKVDAGETRTLSETIFMKRVALIQKLQQAAYSGSDFQDFRQQLVTTVLSQIRSLNPQLAAVKLHRRYVEKYKEEKAFEALSDGNVGELNTEIAPLIMETEQDEYAKRFDNFMYGMMLARMTGSPRYEKARKNLQKTATELKNEKATIAAVKAELPLLQQICTEEAWKDTGILELEDVRRRMRGLLQFLDRDPVKIVKTILEDPVVFQQEGEELEPEPMEDYEEKVKSYFLKHRGDVEAVRKLVDNEKLTDKDYKDLEHIFTEELGTEQDYHKAFAAEPFGLVVRKIAKLNPKAAEKAFSRFINDNGLNDKQIAFVKMVIQYLAANGYMDSPMVMESAPFDMPYKIDQIFSTKQMGDLFHIVNSIRDNAVRIG